MRKVLEVIWGVRKPKYFCKEGWTAQIRLKNHDKSSGMRYGPFTEFDFRMRPIDRHLSRNPSCPGRSAKTRFALLPGHDDKKNPFKLRAFTGCLGQFIHFAVAEVADKRAGSESVLTKLSELMFVDVVRRYIVTLPQQDTGWLAGLRDPALASSHGAHPDSRALAWSGSPALLSDIPTTQRLSWSDFAPIRLLNFFRCEQY
jgi:hypothetical protein